MVQIHNAGLDYIISHKNQLDCSDSITLAEGIASNTSDYCCSLGWYNGTGDCSTYSESMINLTMSELRSKSAQEIIDLYAVDNDAKIELNNLYTMLMSYTDSSQVDTLYSEIKEWENNILNSNYSSSCKEQLLTSSTIMRYSTQYWFAQYNLGSNSPWYLLCSSAQRKLPHTQGFWDWVGGLVTVAADVWGFSVGGIHGLVGASATVAYLWWGPPLW